LESIDEIIGLNWSTAIDVWSIGCILYEVQTGERMLYSCEDMRERLAAIDHIMGPFPHGFAQVVGEKIPGLFNPLSGGRILFPPPSCDPADDAIRAAALRITSGHPLWVG